MNGEDLKDIIKEVVLDILGEFKGQIKDVVVNSIIPAVDDAIADFAAEQTAEADASASTWVKIRNKLLINGGIKLIWSFAKKVIVKVLDKADEAETASLSQQ